MTKINSGNQEDLLLIKAIGNGDQQALGRLYDKYAPALAGIICRMVQTTNSIDETLQNVFQLVWNEPALYDASKHNLFTWLIQIARQAAIDMAQPVNHVTINTVYTSTDNKSENCIHVTDKQMFDLLFYKGLTCAQTATALEMQGDELQRKLRTTLKNMAVVKVS